MLNINLLPPHYKKEIAASKDNTNKVKILIILISLLFATMILNYFLTTFLNTNIIHKILFTNKIQHQLEINEPIEQEFKNFNSRISQLKKILNSKVFPTNLYYEIGKLKPKGITIKVLTIESDPKKKQIIVGETTNLDSIAEFKNNLINSNSILAAEIKYITLNDNKFYIFEIELMIEKGALK